MTDEDDIKDLLDDDDIRNYFQSRDPKRKKTFINPDETSTTHGKASALKPKEDEEVHGVSFTQHVKRTKEAARHFTWIGISVGLFLAIVLTLLI